MTFKTLSVKKLKCFSSKLVGNFKNDHSPGHIARGNVALPPNKGYPSGELHYLPTIFYDFSDENPRNLPCCAMCPRPIFIEPEFVVTTRQRPEPDCLSHG